MRNITKDIQENDPFSMFGNNEMYDFPDNTTDLYGYVPDNCFSIHTFSIYFRLNSQQYKTFINRFYECNSSKAFNDGFVQKGVKTCFTFLVNKGINMVSFVKKDNNIVVPYYMTIKVNPKRLLQQQNSHVTIIHPDDLIKIPYHLNKIFKHILGEEIDILGEGIINRIDYCTNFELDDGEVESYIRLLVKSKLFRKYSVDGTVNKSKVSRYKIKNKSQAFEIYSKYHEMEKNKSKYHYTDAEIRKARGVIRIEFRPRRKKIWYIIKKYGIHSNMELLELSSEIGKREILSILYNAYGTGHFFGYDRGKERIINSESLTNKSKIKLIEVLDAVHEYPNLSMALNSLDINNEKWRRYQKKFNQNYVNPIASDVDVVYPNPIWLIKNENINYG